MANRFVVTKIKDEIAVDLVKKVAMSPALMPYIVAQIAGAVNIQLAVPGILSGSERGFGVRTGKTRLGGLKAIFKNNKSGFQASLWTPLFNIFTKGTKRGIQPVPLIDSLDRGVNATGIGRTIIEKALDDFDKNQLPDLQKYLLLGTRRRRR